MIRKLVAVAMVVVVVVVVVAVLVLVVGGALEAEAKPWTGKRCLNRCYPVCRGRTWAICVALCWRRCRPDPRHYPIVLSHKLRLGLPPQLCRFCFAPRVSTLLVITQQYDELI